MEGASNIMTLAIVATSRFPQGLKPHWVQMLYGGAEAPPLQNKGFVQRHLAMAQGNELIGDVLSILG
jgi:hypothetical protein